MSSTNGNGSGDLAVGSGVDEKKDGDVVSGRRPIRVRLSVTDNNPRMSHRYDANTSYPRSGWKRHAVIVPEDGDIWGDTRPLTEVPRALCGLRPKSGWGCDLFEDHMDVCARCQSAMAKRDDLEIDL